MEVANLGLNVLDADDGLLVLLRGLLVLPLFVELVPLTVQHRDGLHPLLIAESPRLPVVLTRLFHLPITHTFMLSCLSLELRFTVDVTAWFSCLQQLQDEEERLGFLHQLIQVFVSKAVVSKHVGHATRVNVPVYRVFALSYTPHALGHQWVDTSVLHWVDTKTTLSDSYNLKVFVMKSGLVLNKQTNKPTNQQTPKQT